MENMELFDFDQDEVDEAYRQEGKEMEEMGTLDGEEEIKDFKIDTPALADWAIRKVKEEKERLALFEEATKENIDLLKENLEKEKNRVADKNSFLLFHLSKYLETTPYKKTKTKKSLKLPSGTIAVKLSQIDFESLSGEKSLSNDKLVLEWCKENAKEKVKVAESVDWAELKKDLEIVEIETVDEETGEIENQTVIRRKSTKDIVDCIGLTEKPGSVDVE